MLPEPAISGDGRFVVFLCWCGGYEALFVRDRQTGSLERVGVALGGGAAGDITDEPAISADGRFVAFTSWASNLVAGDTNREVDVFVHDRRTAATERVSVTSDGAQALPDGPQGAYYSGSGGPAISADGRYVTFRSIAPNLVAGDTNGTWDVFVRDRQTATTRRVGVGAGGQANGSSSSPAISADGRLVSFESGAANLVAGDTNGTTDVFVRDWADMTPPRVMTPWFAFQSPFPLDANLPALNRVRWSASDASGICRHELEHSVDGGAFAPVALAGPTAVSIVREHAFGRRYRYRLRASDCAGNTSVWRNSRGFAPGVVDCAGHGIRYAGSWSPVADSDSFGGTLSRSLSAGDSASHAVTARRLAWIAPRGPEGGIARVYLDGVEVATVNLAAPSARPRQVVWQKAWRTSSPHTIRIEAVSGRVDIDAFARLS